jgi:hypothetical protein
LATTLTRTDSEALRFRLLDGIRRIVPGARTVAIRDWQVGGTRIDPPQQAGLVTFEIPTSDPRRIAILDAVPCPGRQLDDWDLQTLALSSQVGALVLEVESQRLAARQEVRPPAGTMARRRSSDRRSRCNGCARPSRGSRPATSRR